MKPTRPIFKWKPHDYLDPHHLRKAFAKWRRDYARDWNDAHAEDAERSKAAENVRPMKKAVR